MCIYMPLQQRTAKSLCFYNFKSHWSTKTLHYMHAKFRYLHRMAICFKLPFIQLQRWSWDHAGRSPRKSKKKVLQKVVDKKKKYVHTKWLITILLDSLLVANQEKIRDAVSEEKTAVWLFLFFSLSYFYFMFFFSFFFLCNYVPLITLEKREKKIVPEVKTMCVSDVQ